MSLVHWVWLQQALGYGYKHTKAVLEFFGSAENVFTADISSFKSVEGLSKKVVDNLLNKNMEPAGRIIKNATDSGISVLYYNSPEFPERLREIPAPPLVLYAKGNVSLLNDEVSITIVGPRKVSVYGKKAAFSLAARLSLCGFTVVSGGALGSDTAAHKGSLSVSGKTICVLGSGINTNYLETNKDLREEIADKGLLLSEFEPTHKATKYTFPIRNRLMAGLTLGTVVIEAGDKSGSLITANAVAEFGKDVFVIPGNPSDMNYLGSNALLRDGAKPLLELGDIITEYLPLFPHKIKPEKAYSQKISMDLNVPIEKSPRKTENIKKNKKIPQENLSNNAKMVYNYLDKQLFYIDDLSSISLTDSEVLAAITELEIFGVIKAMPGGKYEVVN